MNNTKKTALVLFTHILNKNDSDEEQLIRCEQFRIGLATLSHAISIFDREQYDIFWIDNSGVDLEFINKSVKLKSAFLRLGLTRFTRATNAAGDKNIGVGWCQMLKVIPEIIRDYRQIVIHEPRTFIVDHSFLRTCVLSNKSCFLVCFDESSGSKDFRSPQIYTGTLSLTPMHLEKLNSSITSSFLRNMIVSCTSIEGWLYNYIIKMSWDVDLYNHGGILWLNKYNNDVHFF